jgi:transposase
MGLDIHKDTIVACLLTGEVDNKPESEIRTFSTLIPDMQELRKWVEESGCHHIAMESTGIYWQPVYETLEDCFASEITLLVVNARHMKNVPGKKTDMRDSEWISTLLRAGLLSGSFIPDKEIRELRHLTRYRKSIVRDITSQKNRIEKFLQSSGFRISSFISDIFGASGRNILQHLVSHGFMTMEALDGCLKTKTRKNIKEIMVAVNGNLSMHQRGFLKMMLGHLEELEKHRGEIEISVSAFVERFSEEMLLLCSIQGISVTASSSVISEIGTDMSRFPTSEHICSWAGLAPGNNESAGKKKAVAINKGNPYIKSMLCEVAWVIAGKRNTYLSGWYWRIKQQKGAKRGIIALARKILVIIYTILKSKKPFDEGVFEQRKQKNQQKRASKLIHELTSLGYSVERVAG